LVLMEDTLGACKNYEGEVLGVLILVLMEDTLGALLLLSRSNSEDLS
ncbi:hypothetical protein HMPREF9148_02443, partial [Prevotella sp. F0091]